MVGLGAVVIGYGQLHFDCMGEGDIRSLRFELTVRNNRPILNSMA
jgi:hypothetical protein